MAQNSGTDIGQAYVQIIPTAKGIQGSLEDLFGGGAGGAGKHIGGKVAAGIVGAIGAAQVGKTVSAFLKDSVSVGSEFDKAMAQVAATMGKSVNDIGDLREFAQDMGASTAFSATQAAEALNYMALANYDAEQSMKALPNVLNLAAAGGIDLAYASDMVTDAQSALGLTFEESAKLVDKMAKASSKSNTSVAQLGEAILTVGGTAKDLRGGTTELATVLGILADNGIKGAEGGTALRNVILSLSAPTDQAAALMEELGINAFDADGNMLPLQETFGQMNKVLGTMTQKKRTEVLNTIFNKVDLKSVNALLGTSAERFGELAEAIDGSWYTMDSLKASFEAAGITFEGLSDQLAPLGIDAEDISMALNASGGKAEIFAEMLLETADAGVSLDDVVGALGISLEDLQGAFDSTSGAAEQMAETQLDSLAGDVTILNSALEGLKIGVFDQMKEPIRQVTEQATGLITQLTTDIEESGFISSFIADVEEKIPTVSQTISGFAGDVGELAAPLLELGGWLIENPEVITGLFTGIGAAIVTNNLVSNLPTVATNIKTLLAAASNPANLAIFGVSLAVGALVGVFAGIKAKNAAEQAEELAKHFGSIQLSLKDLKTAANTIVDSGSLRRVSEALSAFERSESAISAMDSAVQTLNRANWKVSIGMALTGQEASEYQAAVESYTQSCQTWIDEQAYGVHLSLALATEDLDTSTEKGALASQAAAEIETFYQGKQQELKDLGTELNEYVTTAFNDGLLDIDVTKVQELQQQMAEIQRTLATSTFSANLESIGMSYSGVNLTPESFQNLQNEINTALETAKASLQEELTYNIASVNVALENGAVNATEAEALKEEIKASYLSDLGELELKVQSFSLNTIMDAYGEQLEAAVPGFAEKFDEAIANIKENPDNISKLITTMSGLADNIELDSDARANISKLLEGMAPTTEELQILADKYQEYGMDIPENISTGLKNAAVLEAMTGDLDAMFVLATDELINSEALQSMMDTCTEEGVAVPENFKKAIEQRRNAAAPAIDGVYQTTADYLRQVFSNGFDVSAPVRVHTSPVFNAPTPAAGTVWGGGHASGAIVTRPELALIGEGGYPESIIPWDGSRRALDLWMQTGQEIGAFADAATLSRVSSTVSAESGATAQPYSELQQAVELLTRVATSISDRTDGMQIVLDSGELVGAISGKLDTDFARKTVYQSRRN